MTLYEMFEKDQNIEARYAEASNSEPVQLDYDEWLDELHAAILEGAI